MTTIAVTGSTGALGGLVARELAAEGAQLRLVVRTASRAPALPGAEVHACSYGDRDASRVALDGVDVLFMVSAAESADRLEQHRTFIDAARAAGVSQIVYTSFLGAAPDATFTLARDHGATEEAIVASGLKHTFLRDNFYLDVFPLFVGDDGAIRGPAGDGRVSAVARSDVAAVAASVLRATDSHVGATYDLTGGAAFTLAEAAATITETTGRSVRYVDETIEEAYASRAVWNAPDWQLDAWVSTYTAIASGALSVVSPDVERLLGRAPLTLRELLR